MHVKYASRHVLYSPPNATDVTNGADIVARPGWVALRADVMFERDVWDTDWGRADIVPVNVARAVVPVRELNMRSDCANGVVAGRTDLVVRACVDGVRMAVLRIVDWLDDFVVLGRGAEFVPRTAALAMPILTQNAMMNNNAFLISYII